MMLMMMVVPAEPKPMTPSARQKGTGFGDNNVKYVTTPLMHTMTMDSMYALSFPYFVTWIIVGHTNHAASFRYAARIALQARRHAVSVTVIPGQVCAHGIGHWCSRMITTETRVRSPHQLPPKNAWCG